MIIPGRVIAHRAITPIASTGITAADLIASDETRANAVMVTVETQVARYRIDGSAPTASTGHVMQVAAEPVIFTDENSIRNLRFIDTAAGASTVRYTTLRI